ncbi:unnamed protein product, partial [Rotaria sp. Silwood1]
MKNEFSSIDDLPRITKQREAHKADCQMRLLTSTRNTILSLVS